MIWGETDKEYVDRMVTPTPWFAWHPVMLDTGRWIWLETVLRYRADFRGSGVIKQPGNERNWLGCVWCYRRACE